MKTSKPNKQNFFMFSEDLKIERINETLSEIESLYFTKPMFNLNITTTEENYSQLQRDEFVKLAIQHKHDLNILQYIANENGASVTVVFQFKNDNVGPNGNYNLLMNNKEDNAAIETLLWGRLDLKKYSTKNSRESEYQMIVQPIFAGRRFENKPKSCFLLMPFTELWSNRVWKKVRDITATHNFACKRADDLFGHDILEDIWTAINEAECIIADTTSKNPNVFYEIGIAHTLGKRVILLTQNAGDIPFDFRRYRHIVYEDNVDGFNLLEREIPKFLNER